MKWVRTQSNTMLAESPTIFKIDDWEIQGVDRGEYAFIKINSIIVHICTSVHSTQAQWTPQPMIIVQEHQLSHECSYCQGTCPPEIQALWRLQNMEKL